MRQARFWLFGAAVLALGIYYLAGSSSAADDKEKKELREAILKVAAALEKKDAAMAKKLAEGLKGTDLEEDRKSTRLNSSHIQKSRMPSSA